MEDIVDAAGSGDWCTATLIHRMGRTGAEPFTRSTGSAIEAALQDGQAAAAVNCGFRGARGAMQALTLGELNERLSTLGQDTPRKSSSKCADGPKLFRFAAALLRPVRHAGAGRVLDCQKDGRRTHCRSTPRCKPTFHRLSKKAKGFSGRSRSARKEIAHSGVSVDT